MKPFLIDVPVALIFFNRPSPLKEVFEEIRNARPSKLFLIQDGERDGNHADKINMEKCRQVVACIDWDCEVRTNYSSQNLGCGMRIYSGISWCFEYVDRLCIIEDDCKPTYSYFRFCAELLERFKDDQRIDMISGMNNLGTYELSQYSYIFAKTGSIWGWATWRRAWHTIEYNLDFIKDEDAVRLLRGSIMPKRKADILIQEGRKKYETLKKGEKLSAWSYQKGMNMYLQSGLIIVPTKNLISNIGLTDDSVHSVNSIKKIPRALQKLYFMKTYDMEFPLRHPKYVIEDVEFNKTIDELMDPHPFVKFLRRLESYIRRLIY